MTLRPAQVPADPELRVLMLIDRINTDESDDAIEALHRFLEESPENKRLFVETTELRHATSVMLGSERDIDKWVPIAQEGFATEAPEATDAAPADTLSRVAGRPDLVTTNAPWFRRHAKSIGLGAVAAVIGVVALLSYFSQANASRIIPLPDTSVVRRFAQARIDVNFSATERRVDLETGTAAFKVEHDPQHRPFKVYAADLVIEAKGTQFNVFRRPGLTDVYLEQGSLDVFRHQALLLKMKEGDLVHIRDEDGSLVEPPFHRFVVDEMTYAQIADAFNKENAVIQFEVRGAARTQHPRAGNIAVFSRPEAWIEAIRADPSLRVTLTLGVVTIEAASSN